MTATVRAIVERGNPSKLVSATELASGTSLSPSSRPMLKRRGGGWPIHTPIR
eukprot:CAMPEP_0184381792 /NCGR_PEP_ID=MMETSP0007-20130409/5802_1 /TAXON_ID=97485 /ORGANISM="Prymnesium parvum, Strain Texoma1" /LENGTH=51 /DNA_ID=CAMNT_0026727547 /DNA_START=696 /DNA_END=851 /DNA_ORIENTATION=-